MSSLEGNCSHGTNWTPQRPFTFRAHRVFLQSAKKRSTKSAVPEGAGYFYLQAGSVVDARIGVLRGIDAVYYALTLPNAEFEFSVDAETSERTINQPWTQVVLEGLRRLDESISPSVAFPPDYVAEPDELEVAVSEELNNSEPHRSLTPAFLRFGTSETHVNRKPLFIGAVAIAVVGSVAAIGVPAGWYHKTPAAQTEVVTQQAPAQATTQTEAVTQPQPAPSETNQLKMRRHWPPDDNVRGTKSFATPGRQRLPQL